VGWLSVRSVSGKPAAAVRRLAAVALAWLLVGQWPGPPASAASAAACGAPPVVLFADGASGQAVSFSKEAHSVAWTTTDGRVLAAANVRFFGSGPGLTLVGRTDDLTVVLRADLAAGRLEGAAVERTGPASHRVRTTHTISVVRGPVQWTPCLAGGGTTAAPTPTRTPTPARAPTPFRAPTPTRTPIAASGCVTSIVATVKYPHLGGGTQTLSVHAADAHGGAVSGAVGHATVHYSTRDRDLDIPATNAHGDAHVSWSVGGPRGLVTIDVTETAGGCTATTTVGFTGR
jgi:hypothetical protein